VKALIIVLAVFGSNKTRKCEQALYGRAVRSEGNRMTMVASKTKVYRIRETRGLLALQGSTTPFTTV